MNKAFYKTENSYKKIQMINRMDFIGSSLVIARRRTIIDDEEEANVVIGKEAELVQENNKVEIDFFDDANAETPLQESLVG